MPEKQCKTCLAQKPADAFRPNRWECRDCENLLRREKYKNKDQYYHAQKGRKKEWYASLSEKEKIRRQAEENQRRKVARERELTDEYALNPIYHDMTFEKFLSVNRRRRPEICPLVQKVGRKKKSQRKYYYECTEKERNEYRQRYWQNPERERARVKRYKLANPDKQAQWNSTRRKALEGVKKTFDSSQWEEVKARFRNRCAYCGERKPLTVDHVIPVSQGGDHSISNIVPACQACNSSKGNRKAKKPVQVFLDFS